MGDRLKECRIIETPRFSDQRGTLSVIEGTSLLLFDAKRFYYIYDVACPFILDAQPVRSWVCPHRSRPLPARHCLPFANRPMRPVSENGEAPHVVR
jgi:hypothetical protein